MLQNADNEFVVIESADTRRIPWWRALSLSLRRHYPEYLMEAALLGLFMVSACSFAILLYADESPVPEWLPSPFARRVLMGLAMGATAIALVYSRWGKQSGAHLNPAITWTFFRLRKVRWEDAAFYSISQLAGGCLGIGAVALFANTTLAQPQVNYVTTVPGSGGASVAWIAEFAISGALMFVVLTISNHARWAKLTGLAAGAMVAINITIAQPLSGMSMNPSRTFASAIAAETWTAWWVYLTAPPLAMLAAAQLYLWLRGGQAVFCAKLHHQNRFRCIFCQTHADR